MHHGYDINLLFLQTINDPIRTLYHLAKVLSLVLGHYAP
jgi:hypothetical protein